MSNEVDVFLKLTLGVPLTTLKLVFVTQSKLMSVLFRLNSNGYNKISPGKEKYRNKIIGSITRGKFIS